MLLKKMEFIGNVKYETLRVLTQGKIKMVTAVGQEKCGQMI